MAGQLQAAPVPLLLVSMSPGRPSRNHALLLVLLLLLLIAVLPARPYSVAWGDYPGGAGLLLLVLVCLLLARSRNLPNN